MLTLIFLGAIAQQDVADILKKEVPLATSMEVAEFRQLEMSASSPDPKTIKNASLTFALMIQEFIPGADSDVRFYDPISGDALKLHILRRGLATLIHDEDITSFTCKPRGTDEVEGELAFDRPGIVKGKVHYRAAKSGDTWAFTRFMLPLGEAEVVRKGGGRWTFHRIGRHRWKSLEGVKGTIRALAFTVDGRLLSGGDGVGLQVWDLDGGQATQATDLPNVADIAVSPAGDTVATMSRFGALTLWRGESWKSLWSRESEGVDGPLMFNLDGKELVAQGVVWDVASGKPKSKPLFAPGLRLDRSPASVALSVAGDRAAAVLHSGRDEETTEARIWELPSGRDLRTLTIPRKGGALLSPDGRHLVAGDQVWEISSGKAWSLGRTPTAAAFRPDGKLLAVGLDNGTVRLLDSESGAKRELLIGDETAAHRIVFSPDGKRLAAGGVGMIHLWSLEK